MEDSGIQNRPAGVDSPILSTQAFSPSKKQLTPQIHWELVINNWQKQCREKSQSVNVAPLEIGRVAQEISQKSGLIRLVVSIVNIARKILHMESKVSPKTEPPKSIYIQNPFFRNQTFEIMPSYLKPIKDMEKLVKKDGKMQHLRIKDAKTGLIRPLFVFLNEKGEVKSCLGFNKTSSGDLSLGTGSFKRFRVAVDIYTGQFYGNGSMKLENPLKSPDPIFTSDDSEKELAMRKMLRKECPEIFPDVASGETHHKGEDKAYTFEPLAMDLSKCLGNVKFSEGLKSEINKIAIAYQLVKAMAVMHKLGITNGDPKPGNVLILPATEEEKKIHGGDFKAYPTDFGSSRAIGEKRAEKTQQYCAPEENELKSEGQEVLSQPKADIYSLGAIMYELFSNKPPPWIANGMPISPEISPEKFESYFQLDNMPKEQKEILRMALHSDPEQRATAQDLLKYIESYLQKLKHEPPSKN